MGNREERQPLRLLWVFVFGFVFSLAVVAGFFLLFAAQAAGRWDYWAAEPRLNQDQLFGVARNAVTLAAALGVGITLFFSYRKQQTAEKSQLLAIQAQETANSAQELATRTLQLSLDKHDLERVSELRDRYARSAEQLGSEKTAVQLAGIHSLAALADDWAAIGKTDEQQVCISLLCSFMNGLNAQGSETSSTANAAMVEASASRLSYDPAKPEKSWGRSRVQLHGAAFGQTVEDVRVAGGNFYFGGCIWVPYRSFHGLIVEGDSSLSIDQASTDPQTSLGFDQAQFLGGLTWINIPEQVAAKELRFGDCRFDGGQVAISSSNKGVTDVTFSRCTLIAGKVSISLKSGSVTFRKCTFEASDVARIIMQSNPETKVEFINCKYGDAAHDMAMDPQKAVLI